MPGKPRSANTRFKPYVVEVQPATKNYCGPVPAGIRHVHYFEPRTHAARGCNLIPPSERIAAIVKSTTDQGPSAQLYRGSNANRTVYDGSDVSG